MWVSVYASECVCWRRGRGVVVVGERGRGGGGERGKGGSSNQYILG